MYHHSSSSTIIIMAVWHLFILKKQVYRHSGRSASMHIGHDGAAPCELFLMEQTDRHGTDGQTDSMGLLLDMASNSIIILHLGGWITY